MIAWAGGSRVARSRRAPVCTLVLTGLVAACSTQPSSEPAGTATVATIVTTVTAGTAAPATDAVDPDDVSSPDTAPPESTPTTGQPIATEPTATEPTATEAATESTAAPPAPTSCVATLTVRERVALLVWPAVYADDWPGAVATVRDHDIGGVLLMSQDGIDGSTVTARLAELEAASRHGLIVSTDEEGGDVQRLRGIASLDSQRIVGRDATPADAEVLIAAHGALVRDLGVDMVLGPVVDVEPNVGEVPLEPSRFFAGPPDVVSTYGAAYLSGWAESGLFATIKHYPGHGAASGDTHITAGVTPSLSDLESFDLKPYRDLRDLALSTDAAVMIGHLTVPGLTDGVPATRSSAAVTYLRDDLGYGEALLMTDALGMAAVGIPEPEASVLALQAGIDVVLFTATSQTAAVIDAVEAAVADGTLAEQHVTDAAAKVMSMLGRDGHTCDSNR